MEIAIYAKRILPWSTSVETLYFAPNVPPIANPAQFLTLATYVMNGLIWLAISVNMPIYVPPEKSTMR